MSIVEDGRAASDARLLPWIVYGLAVASLPLGFCAVLFQSPVAAALTLVAGPTAVALALTAPERFELKWRGGDRAFTPAVTMGAVGPLLAAGGQSLIGATPWIVAGVCGAAAAGLSYLVPGRTKLAGPIHFTLVLGAAAALYGYYATVTADLQFDSSPGQVMQASVITKYVTHSRSSTTYHLGLAPWGPFKQPTSAAVPQSLYDALNVGDPVCPTLHPGAVGIPWYGVVSCAAPASPAAS